MYYEQQLARALEALVQQGKVTIVSGITVDISAFSFWRRVDDAITLVTAAAANGVVLTDNTLNYIYVVESTATITVATVPGPAGTFPLAEVTTLGGAITNIDDQRALFNLPWENNKVVLQTKGDLVGHDGTDEDILPVGAPGAVLTADPGSSLGFDWIAPTPPGPHAASHISTGADPIPVVSGGATGLMPSITSNTLDFFNGGGIWGPLPVVTTVDAGVVPARDGVQDNVLGGDNTWRSYRTVDWWRFANATGALSASIGTNPHQNVLWATNEGDSGAAGVTIDVNGRITLDRPVGVGRLFTYEIQWFTTKINNGNAFFELHEDDDLTVIASTGDGSFNTVNNSRCYHMSWILDVDDSVTAALPNIFEIWFNGNIGMEPDVNRNKLIIKRYRLRV